MHSHYLILGASHAALSAVAAIRMADPDSSLTLVAREPHWPYSPTVLPYVVSGRSDADRIARADEAWFERQGTRVLRGSAATAVDPVLRCVRLADGRELFYDKLLVATGARPFVPPVPGLADLRFHVLRTLDDALALRDAARQARRAVVLGAGLIGSHAAENLAKAGVAVTVVEREPRMLPAYFDREAAAIIERRFAENGVRVLTGTSVRTAEPAAGRCRLGLQAGDRWETLEADLLVVGAGVVPATDFLDGTRMSDDRGIPVDDTMAAAEGVWAAGDCARVASFYGGPPVVGGILPDAVEQGRVAGQAMAADSGLRPYAGAIPLNTCAFFGHQAVSVGVQDLPGAEVHRRYDPAAGRDLKIVTREGRLAGIFGIDWPFDGGVMWELILRRVDLAPIFDRFLADPRETARALMSSLWR
ncbi:MAG: NAD(P)/FAD-dependent oxidoreductase [Rhodocyclaceae bacterium]|nr:NAD(P)/FAD-dependent oxidoreductase [Rhodocyclaceae bacterium]